MKRIILLFAAIVAVLLPLGAKHKSSTNQLIGAWQMCVVTVDHGRPVARFAPFMKILSSDGTFVNISMQLDKHFSMINTMGRWSVKSDSMYVESIKRSVLDPGITGVDNEMVFKFQGPDFLQVKFRLPNMQSSEEFWVRITQPERVGMGSNITRTTDIDVIKNAIKSQQNLMPSDE